MTITVAAARNEYTANAGQTIFSYTFKIFEDTDLNVYVTPAGQDANDSTDLTTAYTVSGVGDASGGSVTLTTPANLNDLVTIVSDVPSSRTTDYQNNGDFRPDTVNADFDRVVSIAKKVEDLTNRALLTEQAQQGPKPLSLPQPEAGKVLSWRVDLSGMENKQVSELSNGLIASSNISYAFSQLSEATTSTDTTLLFDGAALNIKERTTGNGGGAMWDVVLASTVTPNTYDVVACTGVPALALELRKTNKINIREWGAISGQDATASIQAAADYVEANSNADFVADGENIQLWGRGGSYTISSALNLTCNMDLTGVEFIATFEGNCISVGHSAKISAFLDCKFPKVKQSLKPSNGWTGVVNSVGVALINILRSNFTYDVIRGFGTGINVIGDSNPTAYNQHYLRFIDDCFIGVNFLAINAPSGFVNENNFFGGTIRINSNNNAGAGIPIAGTRYVKLDGTTNGTKFYGTTLEGDFVEYNVQDSGAYNLFDYCRWESSTGVPKILYSGAAGPRENLIRGGYDSERIVYTYSTPANEAGNLNRVDTHRGKIEPYSGTLKSAGGLSGRNCINAASNSGAIDRYFSSAIPINQATDTEWVMEHSANGVDGKRAGDAETRIRMEYANARLRLGDGVVDVTTAPTIEGVSGIWMWISNTSQFSTSTDNVSKLGGAAYRWTEVYAANGTINTSDRREKEQIAGIDDLVLDAWETIKQRKFKWIDAVKAKGENARWHLGYIAQDIVEAFAAKGLDAHEYGVLCYDEWEEMEIEITAEERDVDGNITQERTTRTIEAGNRYGVRYDQASALEAAMIRRKLNI